MQHESLHKTLSLVAHIVPRSQAQFTESGVHPGEIQSQEEMRHMPHTTKEEMRVNNPYGKFAVSQREVGRDSFFIRSTR